VTAETTELARLIDPWLQHMRWRKDFASWRSKRIQSENHQAETLAQTAAAAGPLAHRRLLDLGCGMGGFAVAAAREGAEVTALDYHAAYCAITATRADQYGLRLPVAQAAGEALPLPDRAYDVVCAWDVLEHVQEPGAVLAEVARVLRPGGTVVLTAINRFAFRDPHYHLAGINYLPRALAERVIGVAGRSKRRAAFRDRQALSTMHYYTWCGFKRFAADHGFRARDLDEERVRRGEWSSPSPFRRRLLALLERFHLALPLYRLNRAVYQGTYRLALHKQAGDERLDDRR
jgi:ubiquinone/menaquinone biosynthesis C-methylase UbiE